MSKGKLLAVAIIWLLIVGAGALAWRAYFAPARRAAEAQREKDAKEREAQEREARLKGGGSPSRYRHTVDFQLDAFSGYALIRSSPFERELGDKGIRLQLKDDQADYLGRIKKLQSGDADMAVFTIDALVKVCAEIGDLPATVVAVIDETTGADAIVTYRQTLANVDALNRPDMRFVLTANSPSETLARVVMTRFNLDNLAESPFVEMDTVEDVVRRYEEAKPADPLAFVLWEPYVSQLLKNSAMQVVVDSARFPSTIVDVIVASDDFVAKNPTVVKDFVEAYLRTVYEHRERGAMVKLVMDDARKTGAPLTEEQANKLVDGIWWKNTQENLAHLGFLPEQDLPHLEDMIHNITDVLVSTGAIDNDPTGGNPSYLYFSKTMQELRDFHPGFEPESVRDVKLPSLSDTQWEQLSTVGTARVPSLVFARGTDQLTEHSLAVLDELARKLKTTYFYVLIRGNASRRGDLEQNKLLAERRAKAAQAHLVGQGIDPNRIRAIGVEPSGTTSVTFVLGQPAY